MKVLVSSVYGETITCKHESGEIPEVGSYYYLEDARYGTLAQNRLFHKLVRLYYDSQCFSDDASDFYTLRQHVLRRLGKGFEKYLYVGEDSILHVTKDKNEIPEWILADPWLTKGQVRAQLYSWSAYSLMERRSTIKSLIIEMKTTGVTGKDFEELLREFDDG